MAYKRGTRFGMRLYIVNAHNQHSNENLSFKTDAMYVEDGAIVDDLVKIANDHLDERHFGVIRLRNYETPEESEEDQPAVKTEPAIKIVSAEYHGGVVRFEFTWGRTGAADEGMGRKADEDVPLDGRAPSNQYMATLFPPTGDGSAMLAVEARGRVCAGEDLCRLLSLFLKEAYEARHPRGSAKIKKTLTDTWWRIVAKPAGDRARLIEVMEKGHAAGAVLRKYRAGVGRQSNELELRQNLVPASLGGRVKATVLTWGNKNPSDYGIDEDPLEGDSIEQVEAIIDQPIAEVDWDAGAILYEMPEGDRVTFEPGNLRDVFTYPIAIGRNIDFTELESHARTRIKPLMKVLGLELELE